MSAATATAEDATAPKKGGKKKLIIIIAIVALLAAAGGGAALFMMKKKKAAAEGEEEGDTPAQVEHAPAAHAPDISHPPTFVPLENFTVNLADKDAERYAQIGVTLQVDDPKFAEGMKAFMPAIRNGILMVLAHKTSEELLSRDGKENLAEEIMREAVRPMGIEADDEGDAHAGGKKKKKRKAAVHNPVTQVLFSSFIVQ
jgi:flagellar protein FliL